VTHHRRLHPAPASLPGLCFAAGAAVAIAATVAFARVMAALWRI
jgi:hypothetical protein